MATFSPQDAARLGTTMVSVGAFLFLASVAMSCAMGNILFDHYRHLDFPPVTAAVSGVESRPARYKTGEGYTQYRVTCTYAVEGEKLSRKLDWQRGFPWDANAVVLGDTEMPLGHEFTVYYNPINPEYAIVERIAYPGGLIRALVIAWPTTLLLLAWSYRRLRRTRSASDTLGE